MQTITHKAFQGMYILVVDLNWIDPQVGLKPTTPCPISDTLLYLHLDGHQFASWRENQPETHLIDIKMS